MSAETPVISIEQDPEHSDEAPSVAEPGLRYYDDAVAYEHSASRLDAIPHLYRDHSLDTVRRVLADNGDYTCEVRSAGTVESRDQCTADEGI